MKHFLLAMAAGAVLASATAAYAQDANKLVWGGGDPAASAYSGVYVPRVIDVLSQHALNGYTWGGKTAGTLDNAIRIAKSPTNLAVGQWDILRDLAGKSLPDGSGKFAYTVLAQNIGPECLYMVTKQAGYNTWGDVLGNAWDMNLATGTDLSGSFGTWQVLTGLYTDLADTQQIDKYDDAGKIVQAVIDGKDTHGFFVQRPDPNSDVFKKIADAKLTYVPIVDFDLEGKYDFESLKVAYGGIFGQDNYVTTACTSVALITGDPKAVDPASGALIKRLNATIDRISKVSPDDLKPNLSTWQDMWGAIKDVAVADAQKLMEESKKALDELNKKKPA